MTYLAFIAEEYIKIRVSSHTKNNGNVVERLNFRINSTKMTCGHMRYVNNSYVNSVFILLLTLCRDLIY